MLRVGLTGGLGSGKSTVAAMLGELGARVISSDDLGRAMMQPGQPVFAEISRHFGPEVMRTDGKLDRAVLARMAFLEGRVEELNAIVHPAVIARQEEMAAEFAERDPQGVFVVESALLFETGHAGPEGWRRRFDCLVLVAAEEEVKIARFVERERASTGGSESDLVEEARRRLATQMPDAQKTAEADFVLSNDGSVEELSTQVQALWAKLLALSRP